MDIYTTFLFDRSLKKQKISDHILCKTAHEIGAGIIDAKLGAGVYKKRIPLGKGKRGGARTIVAFCQGDRLFFIDGWTKADVPDNGQKEIPDDELDVYRSLARDFLAMPMALIQVEIAKGHLREVKCHEPTETTA